MFRTQQILENFVASFIKSKGHVPSAQDINIFLAKTLPYSPLTKPMVPLKGAESVAPYISETLKSLLTDRIHLTELAENLQNKTKRTLDSTIFEVQSVDDKISSILNTQKDNTFKTVYNQVPELYDAGDMQETFLWASSVADLYLIEDDSDTQSIIIAAHNVKKGPEGISLTKSSEKLIKASIKSSLYSENNSGTTMKVLNDINPIEAIISGTKGSNKGLSLQLSIKETFVSEIELDINPCTIEVMVDNVSFFTKTLDGPTFLNISKQIKENITLNLYGEAAQVYLKIKEIKVVSSEYSAAGSYGSGRYVAVDLDIDTSYGGLLFKPDEYLPNGTSIKWEYSSNTTDWFTINKDTSGNYMPIDWNKIEKIYEPSSAELTEETVKFLDKLPYINAKNVALSVGKGAILFVTKELVGFYGFIGYITPKEETGYTLDLYNPSINSNGDLLYKRISIVSDTFSFDEKPKETISIDIPKGTHKMTLELFQNDSFNLDNSIEKDTEGSFIKRDNYSDIIAILRQDYLIDISILFNPDAQGRALDLAIQPYSLTEVDNTLYPYLDEKTKINSFFINNNGYIYSRKLKNSSKYYDVMLFNDIYSTDFTETITAELQNYAGDGTAAYVFNIYFSPVVVNGVWDNLGVDITTNVVWDNKSATVPAANLPDTTTSTTEQFSYSGEESFTNVDLSNTPINGVTAFSYNFDSINEVFSETLQNTATADFTYYEAVVVKENSLSALYADLSREALSSDNIVITWDEAAVWNSTTPFPEKTINISSDSSIVDLSTTSYSLHDEIWVKYTVRPSFSILGGELLTISNIPTTAGLHKLVTQTIEVSSAQMSTQTNIIPVDNETSVSISPSKFNDITVTVTDSNNNSTVNKTSSISSIDLESIIVDLSEFYSESSSKQFTVTVTFHTMAVSEPLIIQYSYEYFASVYFKFSYDYIRSQVSKIEEIYNNQSMLQHFYDISYYVTVKEDDPTKNIKLHLMATLEGNKTSSPVIRRLAFERQ